MSYFLNVENSLSNKRWLASSKINSRKSERISQIYNIPLIVSQLISKQDIEENEIDKYLKPRLKDLLPNPSIFLDMDKSIKRLITSINNKEKILIYGDYDVDGIVSSTILKEWIENFNLNVEIYFPNRIKEGYGPNNIAFQKLSREYDLIICVDCGTNSIEPIDIANKNNTDVIIIDHHQNNLKLPNAHSIVNPNRTDEQSRYTYLCGAGMTFIFLVAANREIRKKNILEPNLIKFLDLVGIATIADVVPLKGLNRAFIIQGIKVLKKRERLGLSELLDLSKQYNEISSSTLGFNIAPKINACGRISNAKIAVELLSSKNKFEAKELAFKVEEINNRRKSLEDDILNAAYDNISVNSNNKMIWTANKNWHQGVIGIIAGRLKEKFNKPSLVISINNKGICIGSGRSTIGINLYEKLKILISEKLVISGGGHKMAIGFKIYEKNLRKAMERFEFLIPDQKTQKIELNTLEIDNILSIKSLTSDLINQINMAGPFGNSNVEPIYAFANCKINFFKIIKDKHLKLIIQDETGHKLDAFYFNAINSESGQEIIQKKSQKYHFAGSLDINYWKGNSKPILIVKDISKI